MDLLAMNLMDMEYFYSVMHYITQSVLTFSIFLIDLEKDLEKFINSLFFLLSNLILLKSIF